MKLQDSYDDIVVSDIDVLCGELEVQLPKDYVEFLLRNNGGQPEKNHYSKSGASGVVSFDFDLNVFYGIGGNDTSFDILTMYSIYCDKIPEELLPIGDDGVGNIICIGIEDEYRGKVYMWWKRGQVDEGEEPSFENIDLIDGSLNEFLSRF